MEDQIAISQNLAGRFNVKKVSFNKVEARIVESACEVRFAS